MNFINKWFIIKNKTKTTAYTCATLYYYIIENWLQLHFYVKNLKRQWHFNVENVTLINFQHWYLTHWPGLIFNTEMWPSGHAVTSKFKGLSMASKYKVKKNSKSNRKKKHQPSDRVSGSFICWVKLLNRPGTKGRGHILMASKNSQLLIWNRLTERFR